MLPPDEREHVLRPLEAPHKVKEARVGAQALGRDDRRDGRVADVVVEGEGRPAVLVRQRPQLHVKPRERVGGELDGGRARAHGAVEEREKRVTRELVRGPRELWREAIHQVLHEVALREEHEPA